MAPLDHLWAGWRSTYIDSITGKAAPSPAGDPDEATEGRSASDRSDTLFTGILSLSDEEGFIVHRGTTCSTLLNAYPYTNGHILVLPNRAVEELTALDDSSFAELWEEVRSGVVAIREAYGCDGVNVGMNLGRAGGAGVPGHLHVHCLPRWEGDTNFMTSVAETRVLPEPLDVSWRKLRAAWPPAH